MAGLENMPELKKLRETGELRKIDPNQPCHPVSTGRLVFSLFICTLNEPICKKDR